MLWQDILIDRRLTDQEITDALAGTFAVNPADVQVIEDIADPSITIRDGIRVLCEAVPVEGDFVLKLALYLRDEALEQLTVSRDDRKLIGQFCLLGNCVALMDDGEIDPYRWLLVRGVADTQPVYLDAEAMDHGRYILNENVFDIVTGRKRA